jgi:hypothetical protein
MPSVPVGNEAVVMDGGGLMVKANALLAVAWLTSVTWMVKLKLPAVVGVPLICPVAEFRATPAGRVPAVTLKVKGNVPPVITRVCEYLAPTVPCGNGEAVVIAGGGFIVTTNALAAVTWLVSVTWMVKLGVPAAVGVPTICPVAEFNERPAGRVPPLTVQVYCPLPPLALNGCEYLAPTVPVDSGELVRITRGGLTVKVSGLLAVAPLKSVTWMVKLKMPAVVGVPLICPVAEFSARPPGKAPTVTAQIYGGVPPLTIGVTEHLTPTVHGGKGGIGPTIVGGGLMVKANGLLAIAPFRSVTWMVKPGAPAVVGVPLICPVPEFNDSPAGNAPPLTAHDSGGVPPEAATICE